MWNNDEERYNNHSQKVLDQYVRDEIPIYSTDTYNELKRQYPNKEDITVYRGINFGSRLAYYKFMKSLNKDGGVYQQSSAAGFSRDKGTAEDFSQTTKTYYPTPEIVAAEDKRRQSGETMCGYCGIILKTTIKKGEAVDVNASTFGIEDEILFEPNKPIKVEVELIQGLNHKVNQENFDVNEYIQNCRDISDPIFQYITINKADRITNETANYIFDLCVPSQEEKDSVIEKRLGVYNNQREELIHNGRHLTVIKEKTFKSWKDEELIEQYHFFTPKLIAQFEHKGCLRPEQYKKLEQVANSILTDAMEVYYNENQNINIKSLEQVSWFAKFANRNIRETYENSMLKRKGSEYHDIQDNMRALNNSGLSSKEKEKKINEYAENIVDLITSISNEKIDDKTRKTKRLSGQRKK